MKLVHKTGANTVQKEERKGKKIDQYQSINTFRNSLLPNCTRAIEGRMRERGTPTSSTVGNEGGGIEVGIQLIPLHFHVHLHVGMYVRTPCVYICAHA